MGIRHAEQLARHDHPLNITREQLRETGLAELQVAWVHYLGAWILNINGEWVGYYLADPEVWGAEALFNTTGLATHAEGAFWYGEVHDANRNKVFTGADMGSGVHPICPLGSPTCTHGPLDYAFQAYMRQLSYLTSTATWVPIGRRLTEAGYVRFDPLGVPLDPLNLPCYSQLGPIVFDDVNIGSALFYGGPGHTPGFCE